MDALTPDPRPAGVCHGAHFGEGPVLAMLARTSALCVAAGGSATPNPLRCAPWLGQRQVGTGKQARRSNMKADLGHAAKGDRAEPVQSIDKLTWRRLHSGEAMPDPLGSIPG
jgi:hypothetical protein